MTGQGRERDTCRFDISSPIWALPDKAWKECGKGVCSDQRRLIRFPPSKQAYASLLLLFFRRDWLVHEKLTLVFSSSFQELSALSSISIFISPRIDGGGSWEDSLLLSAYRSSKILIFPQFLHLFSCVYFILVKFYISHVYVEF